MLCGSRPRVLRFVVLIRSTRKSKIKNRLTCLHSDVYNPSDSMYLGCQGCEKGLGPGADIKLKVAFNLISLD